MSKKFEKHTAQALRDVTNLDQTPSAVFLPPALRKAGVYKFDGTPPDIKGNMVRIHDEADPIGMMIAIAVGMPVATYNVKKQPDGALAYDIDYETLPLDSPIRERMIRALADKIMPRMSISKAYVETKDTTDPAKAEWDALLNNAAVRDGS